MTIVSGKAFGEELERAVSPLREDVWQIEPGSTLSRRFRHNAPIVAQLMAVRLDAPQTRARRRAGQEEGVAAYGATGESLIKARRRTGPSWAA